MAFGARMLCFIFDRLNPRAISPERASDIPSHNIQRVGIFHESNADEVMQIMQQAGPDGVELADSVEEAPGIQNAGNYRIGVIKLYPHPVTYKPQGLGKGGLKSQSTILRNLFHYFRADAFEI